MVKMIRFFLFCFFQLKMVDFNRFRLSYSILHFQVPLFLNLMPSDYLSGLFFPHISPGRKQFNFSKCVISNLLSNAFIFQCKIFKVSQKKSKIKKK